MAASYAIDESVFTKLFEIYPDDPAQGVPMNTGSGLLSTGLMDKRVRISHDTLCGKTNPRLEFSHVWRCN